MRSALAVALVLALVLAGCTHARTPPPTANVTTAVPDVREWENHTRDRERREQVAAFRRIVLARHRLVYDTVMLPRTDEQLAGYLAWLEPRLPAMYTIAAQVDEELTAILGRAARVFPAIAEAPVDVFVGPTLGATNGTVRMVRDAPLLILGVDVQTVVSDSARHTRALIAHELVHVAHARVNPSTYALVEAGVRGESPPLFVSLFSEGLATWGAGIIDMAITREELFMNRTLEAEARAACSRLVPRLLADLESTDARRYADWFFLSGRDPDIPRRFAYVAGFEVVRLMSRRHSTDELLRFSPPAILDEIRTVLAHPSFCLESH